MSRRAPWGVLVVSLWVSGSGCINWDAAELSWCNRAVLENRHAVCDIGDTSVAGAAPAILHPRFFKAPGDQRMRGMASLPSGAYIAGDFDTQLLLGEEHPSRGGRDGFIARLDSEGLPTKVVPFGGVSDDSVVRIGPGPQDSLLVGGTFTAAMAGPGGSSLSTNGVVDSFVALLDADLGAVRLRDLGATSNSTVQVHDVSWRNGTIAVSGRVAGTMNVDGVLIGEPGKGQAFTIAFDEELRYLWHWASFNCSDGVADSAVVGPSGELYVSMRLLGTQGPCSVGPNSMIGDWAEALARIDPESGTFRVAWMQGFFPSARASYFFKGQMRQGYDAPGKVDLQNNALTWVHHPPGESPQRAPFAEVAFLHPNDATPLRETRQVGSRTAAADVRSRFEYGPEGEFWLFGKFSGSSLVLGHDGLQLGPFVEGEHGFISRDSGDASTDWARAFLSAVRPPEAHVAGLHVDGQRRVWVAGTAEEQLVTSTLWQESDGADLFLYLTEPQP